LPPGRLSSAKRQLLNKIQLSSFILFKTKKLSPIVKEAETNLSVFGRCYCCPGLPDFSKIQFTKTCKNIPNNHKIYQMDTKYTKKRKIEQMAINYLYQYLRLQDLPKFTKNWIFGLKICHLATLLLPPVIPFLPKALSHFPTGKNLQ
jgi:hypothetical protein